MQAVFKKSILIISLLPALIVIFCMCSEEKSRGPLLETDGRWIVDRNGDRVKLVSVNWYGPHESFHVADGLNHSTPEEIADVIAGMGFNSVRLPFSNEMLTADVYSGGPTVSANPDLEGKKPIEVFDRVIEALTGRGLYVILNNHTTDGTWCCSDTDGNGLWYDDEQTAEKWMSDWEFLVRRYKGNELVVGADLRNEVRMSGGTIPQWGGEKENDWHRAAEECGNRILTVNPDMLIIVEGINYSTIFSGIKELPVRLDVENRLVYSPHSYPWFLGREDKFGDYTDYSKLKEDLDNAWGFIADEEIAPVWISEFGIGGECVDSDEYTCNRWYTMFIDYLAEKDLGFAWWPLNSGEAPNGRTESWGIISDDWKSVKEDGRWRLYMMQSIMAPTSGPGID